MKTARFFSFAFFVFSLVQGINAQSGLNNIFAAGLEDARRFSDSYFDPLNESIVFTTSSGWYNSAKAKPLGGFEISVIGTVSGLNGKNEKTQFTLNTGDYQNLQFASGPQTQPVSSALGGQEGIGVFVEGAGGADRRDFQLPAGLGSDISFVPTGYLQASVGLIKGTEIKARFLPKIGFQGTRVGLIGAGIQHEFTSHLPADKLLPVAVSGVIGYTRVSGDYDFTVSDIVTGSGQRVDQLLSVWNFSAVVSTKLPIINFYGGLGYTTGSAETSLLGTYEVVQGPIQQTYTDPFTLDNRYSGFTGTAGFKLKMGPFRFHADYQLSEFSNVTAGVHFGFR
jgi:hypothetical protein